MMTKKESEILVKKEDVNKLEKLSKLNPKKYKDAYENYTYNDLQRVIDPVDRSNIVKFYVSNSKLLIELFEKESHYRVKLQSLVKIKDREYLYKVALDKNIDHTFRKEAIDRVKDNTYLGEIARQENNDDIREYTVGKILSKLLLKKLKQEFIKKKLDDASLFTLIDNRIKELPNSISFIFDD